MKYYHAALRRARKNMLKSGSKVRRMIAAGVLGGAALVAGCRQQAATTLPAAELSLQDNDRVMILAPHPDDEILACGGVIQDCVNRRLPLKIVFFTYGDHNEWSFLLSRKHPVIEPEAVENMGLARHDEAIDAAKRLKVAPESLVFLGYPDAGTLSIWYRHWGESAAFRNRLTRASEVPYKNALRPGAPYKGDEVISDLKTVLRDFRPTRVFVSHPSDHNSDHMALYLFTRVALWDLAAELRPDILPYLTHYKRWPQPMKYAPNLPLLPPSRLDDIQWRQFPLPPRQVMRKREAMRCHRTQYKYSRQYMSSFARTNELFGDLPILYCAGRPAGEGEGASVFGTEDRETMRADSSDVSVEEEQSFVGIESRYFRVDASNFVLRVSLSRPLAQATEASIYVFGYSPDRAFAAMPKIHVKIGEFGYGVFDQDRELPRQSVTVERGTRQITVTLPHALMGNPDRVFTAVRTYIGELPLDWASWRILQCRQTRSDEAKRTPGEAAGT